MRRSSIARIARRCHIGWKDSLPSCSATPFTSAISSVCLRTRWWRLAGRFQSEQSPALTEQAGLICCSHSPASSPTTSWLAGVKKDRPVGGAYDERQGLLFSEIRRVCFREREQIVAEPVAIVLSTDELPPFALLLAPARRHVHRLVEGVLVLDLNEGFEKFPVRR